MNSGGCAIRSCAALFITIWLNAFADAQVTLDRPPQIIPVWEWKVDAKRQEYVEGVDVASVALSADGRSIAMRWFGGISGDPDSKLTPATRGKAGVSVWSVDGKLRMNVVPPRNAAAVTPEHGLSISPDGSRVAICTLDRLGPKDQVDNYGRRSAIYGVKIWNVAAAKQEAEFSYTGRLEGNMCKLQYSPNGVMIAASARSRDNDRAQVVAWNLQTRQVKTFDCPVPPGKKEPKGLSLIEFSSDGSTLAASDGKSATVWNVDSAKTLFSQDYYGVVSLAAAPRGDRLSLVVALDNPNKIPDIGYDVVTVDLRAKKELQKKHFAVSSLILAVDGKSVYGVPTGKEAAEFQLGQWDAGTGNLISKALPPSKAKQPAEASNAATGNKSSKKRAAVAGRPAKPETAKPNAPAKENEKAPSDEESAPMPEAPAYIFYTSFESSANGATAVGVTMSELHVWTSVGKGKKGGQKTGKPPMTNGQPKPAAEQPAKKPAKSDDFEIE